MEGGKIGRGEDWKGGRMDFARVLSECTSHLGEYAANRGLARRTRISRIFKVRNNQSFVIVGSGVVLSIKREFEKSFDLLAQYGRYVYRIQRLKLLVPVFGQAARSLRTISL